MAAPPPLPARELFPLFFWCSQKGRLIIAAARCCCLCMQRAFIVLHVPLTWEWEPVIGDPRLPAKKAAFSSLFMAASQPEWAHWLQSWLAWQDLFYCQSLPATVCRDAAAALFDCHVFLNSQRARQLKKIQVLIFSVELSSISGRLSSPDCLCRVWIFVWKVSGAAHHHCLGQR